MVTTEPKPGRRSKPVAEPPAVPEPAQPVDGLLTLIERMALNPDVPVENLREMFLLKKEYEADEARKAYVAAMVAFKMDPPDLVKGSRVDYNSNRGGRVNYTYINLADVYKSTVRMLATFGFSHSFSKPKQIPAIETGGLERIGLACVLTHQDGHSEDFYLEMPVDRSGGKNPSQELASAVTYLQRYTFLSLVGLAAGDQDNDGNGSNWHQNDRGHDSAEEFNLQGASTQRRPPRQEKPGQGKVVDQPSQGELDQYKDLLSELDGIEKFNHELELLDNAKAPRVKREILWAVAKSKGLTWDSETRSFALTKTPSEEVDDALNQAANN